MKPNLESTQGWEEEFDKKFTTDGVFPHNDNLINPDMVKSFISSLLDEAEKRAIKEVIESIPDGFHEGSEGVKYMTEIKQQLKSKYGIK